MCFLMNHYETHLPFSASADNSLAMAHLIRTNHNFHGMSCVKHCAVVTLVLINSLVITLSPPHSYHSALHGMWRTVLMYDIRLFIAYWTLPSL